jgi:hypothetical protein
MLIACWWPFHAPRNSISWGSGDRGVVFERPGVLVGTDPLAISKSQPDAITIELWLRPEGEREKNTDTGTIVAFYLGDRAHQFRIDQYRTGIALRWPDGSAFYAHDAMPRGKVSSVTITSDMTGVSVYTNGKFIRSNSSLHITSSLLSGNVSVGTSAGTDNRWLGELRAFTIHNRVLAQPTVWREDTRPDPVGLQVFYDFQKPDGATIANLGAAGGTLRIPDHYQVPAKDVLAPLDFHHPNDFVMNIIGFIPFGFFACGFLEARRARYPILTVAILSTVFSVAIEIVQIGLPTRDSSLTDVLTNFVGGTAGAWLWRRTGEMVKD